MGRGQPPPRDPSTRPRHAHSRPVQPRRPAAGGRLPAWPRASVVDRDLETGHAHARRRRQHPRARDQPKRPNTCDRQREPDRATVGHPDPTGDRHAAPRPRPRRRHGRPVLHTGRRSAHRQLRHRPRLPLGHPARHAKTPRLPGRRPAPHARRMDRVPTQPRLRPRLLSASQAEGSLPFVADEQKLEVESAPTRRKRERMSRPRPPGLDEQHKRHLAEPVESGA